VAPSLWEYVRRYAPAFDITDAHCTQVALGLAVARAAARRFIFTPRGPAERLLRWRHAYPTRAVVDHAVLTVCSSRAQADVLRRGLALAPESLCVVPAGVDVDAIQKAEPFAREPGVVLAIGRLERHQRFDRAIAAMASVAPGLRLVVVGRGPIARRLRHYAADLLLSPRVQFAGGVQDVELYRWLRTARVVLALADQESSGAQIFEARAAGTPAVASDIAAHREAAFHAGDADVRFVSAKGSPLEIADAINEVAMRSVAPPRRAPVPTWDEVVDKTLDAYEAAMGRSHSGAVYRRAVARPGRAVGRWSRVPAQR
jgi:glycosyltransferase involved in cell wall biosynthesis